MSLRKDDKQIQKQRKECREGKNELKGKNMWGNWIHYKCHQNSSANWIKWISHW